ncbi:lipoprotein insertase outer membrane protein LolB [Rhodanobacter sp. L36]|uniref:lipoprotein insertase outer membrane protein LolB n=1 Tax=Rhodanobacter sp. L36 TaxID=1747221 RepID=UPI00131DB5F6|nr:lipoprotein insertase outer membrane protein LolB [Rhodanobacter sp. L36]
MKRNLRFLAAALPLLLAACAPAVRMKGDAGLLDAQRTREQQLASAEHWTLQGRLSISDDKGHGGTGSLVWTQDGEYYTFEMRGPAISGANFRLSGGPDGALLEGLAEGPLRGPDAEALMRKAVGWAVPLRDLRAWVMGLRADSGPAELNFGTDRLPSLLQQDGWVVDYREWDAAHQPPLPKKVFATNPPYKVRLSIESWSFR